MVETRLLLSTNIAALIVVVLEFIKNHEIAPHHTACKKVEQDGRKEALARSQRFKNSGGLYVYVAPNTSVSVAVGGS